VSPARWVARSGNLGDARDGIRVVNLRISVLGIAAFAAALLAACGGDDKVDTLSTVTVAQNTAPAPTPQLQRQPDPTQELDATASKPEDRVISIGISELKFSPNRWSIVLDEPITIRVTNNDSQQHNLRIAGLDGEYETQDDAVTDPEALQPGESGELTFVPQVAGNYTFRCDFHPANMGGQIEVSAAAP
jgi:plastocyanin